MFDTAPIDTWRFLELIGVWAAAGATYYAARVALRIARRQDEIQLKASASAGWFFDGSGGDREDIVWFKVTNVGRRPVTVNSIGWKLSRLSRVALYQKVDAARGDQLPKTLLDGQQVSIAIPVEHPTRENWYLMFAGAFEGFGRLRRWLALRSLRFCVHCSTGEEVCVRPSNDFLKRLRDALVSKQAGKSD